MEVKQLVSIISDAFDGNWTNDNIGSIEQLQATQALLVSGLSVAIAIFIDEKFLFWRRLNPICNKDML